MPCFMRSIFKQLSHTSVLCLCTIRGVQQFSFSSDCGGVRNLALTVSSEKTIKISVFLSFCPWGSFLTKPCICVWTCIPILAGKQRYPIFLSNKILDYRSNDSLRGVFRRAEIKDLKQMNLIIFVNIHNHIMCFKCHIWK